MKRALIALVACSHPATPPRDPDDDRGGALTAQHFAEHDYWKRAGELTRTDTVDWIRIDVPATPGSIELAIDATQHVEAELYAADGTALAKLPAKVTAATLLYVRVTGTPGSYVVRAQRRPIVDPTVTGTACDRDNFDASNPDCKDKCNFEHPDENNQDCCVLWWTKCTNYHGDSCRSQTIWWVGDRVQAAMGLANGVHGHPRARLHLDQREPDRPLTIEVRATSIEQTRSEWQLVEPDAHDVDWLRKHAKAIEIFVPNNCPR